MSIYYNNLFSRRKVVVGEPLGRHPHTLTLARLWLRCTHIGQDNVTIELTLVDILGWSIKASAAAHNTLPNLSLSLLPSVHQRFIYSRVKRNHSEARQF